ncbi:hypothetical protein [Methanosarcina sp. 1.H.A.2.2]|nr:hypothetical protein [Methanosarcina sp. 1.H.A.2.2]
MKKRKMSADAGKTGTLSFVHAADLHLESMKPAFGRSTLEF